MMKFDLTKVEYSRNDIRHGIKIPEYLTPELAYFLGFHVGDGYMKIVRRGLTVDYRLSYDGHHINEYSCYQQFLKPLIKNLFNKEVPVVRTKKGTVNISFYSKAILTFFHYCCEISFSPKRNIDIPNIIKNSSLNMKANFLRGLADTDFSLSFKKDGKYPTINHGTYSKTLHESVKCLLVELGITYFAATYHRERKGTKLITYHIDINGKKNLKQWMELIGFSSYNTITRYLVWSEVGKLSPGTNIYDRIKILEERGIKFP